MLQQQIPQLNTASAQARMGSGSSKAGMAKAGKVLSIIGICIAAAGWLLNIVLTVAMF